MSSWLICNVWLVLLWNHPAKNPNGIQWLCEYALLGRCPQLFVMYVCDVQLCYDSVWHLFQMLRRIRIRCIGERPRCFAMFHNMDTQTPHADGPYVACWFDRIYLLHHYIIVYLLLHHIILYLLFTNLRMYQPRRLNPNCTSLNPNLCRLYIHVSTCHVYIIWRRWRWWWCWCGWPCFFECWGTPSETRAAQEMQRFVWYCGVGELFGNASDAAMGMGDI